MSAVLSVQHSDDDCACCDPFGEKQRKQQNQEDILNEAELAKEMNELSFEQRERILDDVHGVAAVQEETPEFVDKRIARFDDSMSRIPARDRKAYNRALFLKPKLQNDRKFKLQFLRADEFDADKAAERMTKYFQQKMDLFGEEKVAKKLTMDDLKEEDLYLYEIGYMTILPFTDRSGRPIIFGDGNKLDFDRMTIDNILRSFFYLLSNCYEDEVAQKKGACTIMLFSGARRSFTKSAELARRTAYNVHCTPGRNTSFHACYDDPRFDLVINIIRFRSGQSTRVRTRAHFGTEIENDYKLMTFGIASGGLLQRVKNGDLSMFEQFIQKSRERDKRVIKEEEAVEARTGLIAYPRPNDVLIGRGKPYRDLPGNAVWDVAIQGAFDRYRACTTQFEKTCISMDVVKSVQDTGSRFLEREGDGWKILDDVVARKKTAVAFRNRARDSSSSASRSVHTRTPSPVDITRSHPNGNGHAAKRARFDVAMDPFDEPMDQGEEIQQHTRFNFPW
mmetsp:Transcript_5570/g.8340  ORF Transcript_5570/g.8340 Transcript_5570/m.8340 type:complete len:506 (-) Transcript_5570:491-2008(-)